jgi:hypothetical protein
VGQELARHGGIIHDQHTDVFFEHGWGA